MEPKLAELFDGKKFMWDGKIYETREDAAKVSEEYKKNNFEVEIIKNEEEKYLVYSRRVVKEIIIDGTPPV